MVDDGLMKKMLCAALMTLVGFGAVADGSMPGGRVKKSARVWVSVFADDDSTLYGHVGSIHVVGDKVHMWSLIDYKAPQRRPPAPAPFKSEKFEDEYDCVGKQFRTVLFTYHPAGMGMGPASFGGTTPTEWQPILPGSDIELLSNLACEKFKPPKR